MQSLTNIVYAKWRAVSEEMLTDGFAGSIDCGEAAVRQDFSSFAGLNETITFEEMLVIEREYEAN